RERLMQRVAWGHVQIQHEEGHGDGEDAVAEGLRTACLAHGHRLILIVHVELYTGLARATPTAAASAERGQTSAHPVTAVDEQRPRAGFASAEPRECFNLGPAAEGGRP